MILLILLSNDFIKLILSIYEIVLFYYFYYSIYDDIKNFFIEYISFTSIHKYDENIETNIDDFRFSLISYLSFHFEKYNSNIYLSTQNLCFGIKHKEDTNSNLDIIYNESYFNSIIIKNIMDLKLNNQIDTTQMQILYKSFYKIKYEMDYISKKKIFNIKSLGLEIYPIYILQFIFICIYYNFDLLSLIVLYVFKFYNYKLYHLSINLKKKIKYKELLLSLDNELLEFKKYYLNDDLTIHSNYDKYHEL